MNRNTAQASLVALVLAATVATIWAPYGFDMTAIVEEWGFLREWQENGTTYVALAGGPFESFRLRMFTFLPYAISYTLTPDSFMGWHFMLALSLFLKAMGMALLMQWASRRAWLALAAGLIFLLYPADTMQVSVRGLHAGWTSALLVLALATFMWATEMKTQWGRIAMALLATSVYLVALLVYEMGILFSIAPLFFWWARFGWRGMQRLWRHWPEALIWSLCCVGWLIYAISVVTGPLSHQTRAAGGLAGSMATAFGNLPMLFSVGMYRTFLHGWYDGWRMLADNLHANWPFLVALLLVTGLAWRYLVRGHNSAAGLQPFRWMVVGVVFGTLGFAPYLGDFAHTVITQRTYVFASIGGAIAVVALIWLTSRVGQYLGAALALVLLLSGIGSQWEQLRHYTDLSLRQREIFANIVTVVPDIPPGQALLIIDNGGVLDNTWMARGVITRNALSYLYGHVVDAHVCVNPGMRYASFRRDSRGNPGVCELDGNQWALGKAETAIYNYDNDDLWIVTLSEIGEATLTQGDVLGQQGKPDRWASILNCWPASECVYEEPVAASFVYDFGRYWSLEQAPWGAGWSDAFWNPPRWQPQSASWTTSDQSRLWFKLQPRIAQYLVRIDLTLQSPDSITGSFIEINDQRADLNWDDLYSGVAIIPSSWLKEGVNSLVLHTKVYQEWGLGVAVNRISVTPID